MWCAAEQVYPGRHFDRYAILGDDVVICDKAIALVYKEVLKYLQVKISEGKTLISHSGCAEFGFLVRGLEKALSPVTIKSLLGAHLPANRFALSHRYTIKRFSTFRRLGGRGYKSCGKLPTFNPTDREKLDWCMWVQLKFPSLSSLVMVNLFHLSNFSGLCDDLSEHTVQRASKSLIQLPSSVMNREHFKNILL